MAMGATDDHPTRQAQTPLARAPQRTGRSQTDRLLGVDRATGVDAAWSSTTHVVAWALLARTMSAYLACGIEMVRWVPVMLPFVLASHYWDVPGVLRVPEVARRIERRSNDRRG